MNVASNLSGRSFNARVSPIFATFFLEAFVLGNWIPRIPDVKRLYELSATELGGCLFILAFGTLFAFIGGGRFIKSWGLRNTCAAMVPAWSLGFFLLPFVPVPVLLIPLFFMTGIAVGMLEVGMNSAADRLERSLGVRLMSRAHGFWSLGSLFGALIGGGVASLGVGVGPHFFVVMPLTAIVGWYLALGIDRDEKSAKAQGEVDDTAHFKLPPKAMLLLCLMPVGVMLVEGAFIDWSALFVRSVLEGGPLAAGLIYAAFSLVMAATRLSGDYLLDRYGALKVAKVSAVSATIGIAVFATAINVEMAFLGALFSGLGVAIFYPLAMTAAARRPGDAEDNVAAMSLFAFTAFMLAPPAIGLISDLSSLRFALTLLIPLALASYFLSNELKKDS